MPACRYVDSRAENGLTALHMAAALGDLACVKILLGAGASMMVRTVDLDMQSSMQFPAGSTPLHLAAQRGQIAILQAMLQVRAATLVLCHASLFLCALLLHYHGHAGDSELIAGACMHMMQACVYTRFPDGVLRMGWQLH